MHTLKVTEDALQKSVVQYLAVALPADAMFFAVPNGGARRPAEAAILKGQGVQPGVADLVVVHQAYAMFIELKTPIGRMSADQRWFATRCAECDTPYAQCRSLEDVEEFLTGQGVRLKARAAAANGARVAG